jgi:hypothetical protein
MKLRLLIAVAVLISAVVHLQMWFDGVRDQSVGPAFMVNAVSGVAIAALLVLWRHWVPLLLAVGFGVSTIGAFVISTTVGLFGVHATWEGSRVWIAFVTEAVAVVGGLVAARQEGYLSRAKLEHGLAARRANLH